MKFRTEYQTVKCSFSLFPSKPVVLAGSCFSQNIAAKMTEHGWKALNPFGTLYNPLSIAMALDTMLDRENGLQKFSQSLFLANGLWASRWFDSSFSAIAKEDCLEEFVLRQTQFLEAIREGQTLIITFGTSICYYLSGSDQPVGNCHKQPASLFLRKRLSISEIVNVWNDRLIDLRNKIPDLKVIFTVSPVRHLKDGFAGNSRSKAVLQLAVEQLCLDNSDCLYFPAYEILNDDLRDYRFYAADLAHPSEEAIEYIWQKFIDTFISPAYRQFLIDGAKAFKAAQHRSKTGALGKPLN